MLGKIFPHSSTSHRDWEAFGLSIMLKEKNPGITGQGEKSKPQEDILHLSCFWTIWHKRDEIFACLNWWTRALRDFLASQTQSAQTKARIKLPKANWSEMTVDGNLDSWAQLLAAMWAGRIQGAWNTTDWKVEGVWLFNQDIQKIQKSKSYSSTVTDGSPSLVPKGTLRPRHYQVAIHPNLRHGTFLLFLFLFCWLQLLCLSPKFN